MQSVKHLFNNVKSKSVALPFFGCTEEHVEDPGQIVRVNPYSIVANVDDGAGGGNGGSDLNETLVLCLVDIFNCIGNEIRQNGEQSIRIGVEWSLFPNVDYLPYFTVAFQVFQLGKALVNELFQVDLG